MNDLLRVETIRYGTVVSSKADGMASLIYSTAQKRTNNEKLKKKQKPSSSKEMARAIVGEGSPGRQSETVKQVGFKPGVKERELWMSKVENQKSK